jgi:molecular chaperone Hsp33
MKDYIVRAMAFDRTVRIYAINATQTVKRAQEIHHTWPSATAALGRTIIVSAMMGAMLKGNDRLTVRVKGDGPIGEMLVDANAKGQIRGFVNNPEVHFQYPSGKLNVAATVGTTGEIQVIKDLGLKDYFVSTVELISGELGEDFTYYFAKSEQTPSSVACGVLVDTDNTVLSAGGFIIQLMPGATEETITKIEQVLGTIKPTSQMVDEGYTPEAMVKEIVKEEDYSIISQLEVDYVCQCDKDRFARGLVSIGKKDLQEIIEEDGKADITCHFCNEHYHFDKNELEELLNNL